MLQRLFRMRSNVPRRIVLTVYVCLLSCCLLYGCTFYYGIASKMATRYDETITRFDQLAIHVPHRNQSAPSMSSQDDPIERLQKHEVDISSRESMYKQRTFALSEACKRIGRPVPNALSTTNIPDYFFVEPSRSILYCPIAKVGSSFWLRTLSVMTRAGQLSSPFQIGRTSRGLIQYRDFKQQLGLTQFLSKATSFMITRDPYGRLFSAYVNKLYSSNWMYWRSMGRTIIKTIRNDSSETLGNDVTFEEFVKYVIKLHATGRGMDPHIKPMHQCCDPCSVPFDFIGKVETFQDDAEYLLAQWQSENDTYVKFADFDKERRIDTTAGAMGPLFNAHKHILETNITMHYPLHTLFMKLWRVLQMRGILLKTIEMPLSKQEVENSTRVDLQQVVEDALNVPPVDKADMARQRQEALVEAYSNVSLEDLYGLREFVKRDCELFGFNDTPTILFDRQHAAPTVEGTFRYFI